MHVASISANSSCSNLWFLKQAPLDVDTTAAASNVSLAFPSSPESTADHSSTSTSTTTTLVDHAANPSRHSAESSRTVGMGRFPSRRDRTAQDRAVSMSSATNPIRALEQQQKRSSRPNAPSMHEGGRASPTSIRQPARRTPVVYPALLSRVAQAFRERIPIADRIKDGLTYKDAFDGKDAVDIIAYIIKTTNRNLALLLGRALDAQKFFHDVTYDHRLRDHPNELYRFRNKLPTPYAGGDTEVETPQVC